MKTTPALLAILASFSLPLFAPAAEKSEAETRPFATADKDGDRRISLEEYVAFVAPAMTAEAAKTKFNNFDKNSDGYLSRQEFRASRGQPESPKGR